MSYKTAVIERIFFDRWDNGTKNLPNRVVTLLEVQAAIVRYNEIAGKPQYSTKNPANFFKDFIRNQTRANKNWPVAVFKAGYTARQMQSEGNCFEFIPVLPGQSVPFPIETVPLPDANTTRVRVESVSLPLASKRLGRKDEPWLIQVLIRLRVFETHLALSSTQHVVQLDHLQTNVKLAGSEIDALFLGIVQRKNELSFEVIVCCEAKSRRDDIIPHQILNQVKAAFRMGMQQDVVLPIAVKAIAPSEVYVVEFEPVRREHIPSIEALTVATTAIYEFVPPVPGIGG